MTRRHPIMRPADPPWTWLDTALVTIGSVVVSGVFLALLALFLLAVPAHPARATWKPEYANADPHIAEWFKSQHNANGEWCCDKSDGHEFYGNYSVNQDGSVTVFDGGKKYDLPAYKVLEGANPTGAAVWWYIDLYGGDRNSYCFAIGSMG